MLLRAYIASDQAAVIRLWEECGLLRSWNDPVKDIARKLLVQRELFLVGVLGEEVVATAMGGYDGHRGWVNYLAVSPQHQRKGLGRALMHRLEELLQASGCPKLNLQVRAGNAAVLEFYRRLGYAEDPVVSLGKRLIHDHTPGTSIPGLEPSHGSTHEVVLSCKVAGYSPVSGSP